MSDPINFQVETILVVTQEHPEGARINRADFNPEIHELLEGTAPAAPVAVEPENADLEARLPAVDAPQAVSAPSDPAPEAPAALEGSQEAGTGLPEAPVTPDPAPEASQDTEDPRPARLVALLALEDPSEAEMEEIIALEEAGVKPPTAFAPDAPTV